MTPQRDDIVNIDALGPEIADVVDRAAAGEPVLLAESGRPVAAVVSIQWLQALGRDRELLRRLALGELESAAGEGDDLEAVLEDCRLLLEES